MNNKIKLVSVTQNSIKINPSDFTIDPTVRSIIFVEIKLIQRNDRS